MRWPDGRQRQSGITGKARLPKFRGPRCYTAAPSRSSPGPSPSACSPAPPDLPLFPTEAEGQPSELATRRSDEKMEAASIRQIERFLRRLGLADCDVCQRHWRRPLLASRFVGIRECQRTCQQISRMPTSPGEPPRASNSAKSRKCPAFELSRAT